MEKEIVYINKKDTFINSKMVSEMLEVPHKVLHNTIERIISRGKNSGTDKPLKFPQKFIEGEFKNKMGRTYKMYELNEQAYLKLAMHLKGYEKAETVQDQIIEAFSLMKRALLNHENATWLNARKSGKVIRALETNVIKEFVDYATNQGSQNAKRYYSNVTKMTNKALEILIQVKEGTPIKELATISELGFIHIVENRAMQVIEKGMSERLPYKYIYQQAKKQVNELVDSLNFKAI